MPARKRIDPALVHEWAEAYLIDFASLSEIARVYGVSRALVKGRLEEFHPGMTHDLNSPSRSDRGDEETYGQPEAVRPASNGHGDAVGLFGS